MGLPTRLSERCTMKDPVGCGTWVGRVLDPCAPWIRAALTLVYPEVCALCGAGEAGPEMGFVCADCRGRAGNLRRIGEARCGRCGLPYDGEISDRFVCGNCRDLNLDFDAARAAVVATPFVLNVVHRYKYEGALWFEGFLAGLLAEAAGEALRLGGWDALVPVPLHPVRQRERGFNQAERLARRLSVITGLPVRSRWVNRGAATKTQALLRRGERAHNVSHAFAVRPGLSLSGGRVVVVDDVLTTGSTTSAVSRALRAAGAARVAVWTVARGL